jgi:hypothetical protein
MDVSVVSSALPSYSTSHSFSSSFNVSWSAFGSCFRGGGVLKSGRGSFRSWGTSSYLSMLALSSLTMIADVSSLFRLIYVQQNEKLKESRVSMLVQCCLCLGGKTSLAAHRSAAQHRHRQATLTKQYKLRTAPTSNIAPTHAHELHPLTSSPPLYGPLNHTPPQKWSLCTPSWAARSDRTSYVPPMDTRKLLHHALGAARIARGYPPSPKLLCSARENGIANSSHSQLAIATLSVTIGGAVLATSGKKADAPTSPPINAKNSDEESFVKYVDAILHLPR